MSKIKSGIERLVQGDCGLHLNAGLQAINGYCAKQLLPLEIDSAAQGVGVALSFSVYFGVPVLYGLVSIGSEGLKRQSDKPVMYAGLAGYFLGLQNIG